MSWRKPLLPLAALAACCALAAAPARADGDPASDYLITQLTFLPFDHPVGEVAANELKALLEDAKAKGYPVRVALIASKTDLGAVPVLFAKPQRYADFLGQELVYFFKGPVLVVMPNGYGIYERGKKLPEDKALLGKLRPAGTTDGNALAVSAENAVRALARRRGIELSTPKATSSGSSTTRDRLEIVAGVVLIGALVLVGLQFVRRRAGGPDAA